MEKLKQLVEDFINYTKTWSISETEWYYNVDSVRKSNYINEEHITEQEFEVAVREEILYDLIFNNSASIKNQMENDLCIGYENDFNEVSKDMEKKIQKIFKDFKIER